MPRDTFHVMFRVVSKNAIPDAVFEAAREVLPVFRKQPGFQGSTLFRSHDSKLLVNHLRWDSKGDHEACRSSADFRAVADAWAAIFAAGKVEVQTFETLAETVAPRKMCKRRKAKPAA